MDKDLTSGGWKAKAERRQGKGGRTLEGNRIEGGWNSEGRWKEVKWKSDGGRKGGGWKVIFIYVKIISYFCMNYGHRSREL